MKLSQKNYKRVVIKIGSSLFYSAKLDRPVFNSIAQQVGALIRSGVEVVVVSSGAIALGMGALGLKKRPKQLSDLQAAAAVGQPLLMNLFHEYFRLGLNRRVLPCAQVLLTWDDFNDRKRSLNVKNTLLSLLKYGVVPVINENDTVAIDEIKFGDNDRLSALVSSLISADLLVILSDVDGLMGEDKKTVIPLVECITPQIKGFASPTAKNTCVGGMITKIEAARIAVDSGIPCVIANGRKKDILNLLIRDAETCGTLFVPKENLAPRKRWIAFAAKCKGRISVDDGAKTALLNKKSLLSVGVVGLSGDFKNGDIVRIEDKCGLEFAKGKVTLNSQDLDKAKGKRYFREVVHRDNIVIL